MSKTMLDSKVIETAKFLELKPSARDLYTHLLLSSDDEGFIANPKGITRFVGAKESDLKTLINEGYIYCFPSGVALVWHYWVNNNHDKHNNRPTLFVEEKALIYEDESHVYRLKESPDIKTERRPNSDCKEPKKEPNYKERTNKQTNPVRLVGLSDDSIYYSLNNTDKGQIQKECDNHNCDLVKLLCYVDNSIKNRKEQTPIKNPYRYILQVAEGINWNPDESNRGFTPVSNFSESVIKHYKDIKGSLWDNLNESQKKSMKAQFIDEDIEELIKKIDTIIKDKPEEEYKSSEVVLFMNLANKLI